MIRMVVIAAVGLSIVYLCVSLYSRSVRRSKLNKWYDEEDQSVDRETYIREGMARYDRSVRPKLVLLVYIVPVVAIVTAIYMQNFM